MEIPFIYKSSNFLGLFGKRENFNPENIGHLVKHSANVFEVRSYKKDSHKSNKNPVRNHRNRQYIFAEYKH